MSIYIIYIHTIWIDLLWHQLYLTSLWQITPLNSVWCKNKYYETTFLLDIGSRWINSLKDVFRLGQNLIYIPRIRHAISSAMRGIPVDSNMLLLLALGVSAFRINGQSRLSRLLIGRRLLFGVTRCSLSAAHVSLLSPENENTPGSLSWNCQRASKSTGEVKYTLGVFKKGRRRHLTKG